MKGQGNMDGIRKNLVVAPVQRVWYKGDGGTPHGYRHENPKIRQSAEVMRKEAQKWLRGARDEGKAVQARKDAQKMRNSLWVQKHSNYHLPLDTFFPQQYDETYWQAFG